MTPTFRERGIRMIRTIAAAALCLMALTQDACGADPAQQEANKRTVRDFYDKALNQKDFESASAYLGPASVQHDQNAADGAEGLRAFIRFLRDRYPSSRSEIKRVFADGDCVILHVHAVREPGTRGMAIVDIVRLAGGRIGVHWDVHEAIIEKPGNPNGMF